MRRTTTLAAAAGLALGLCLVPTAASGSQQTARAGETCDGKVATIVLPAPAGPVDDTTETAPVTGTPGDDVIVGSEVRDEINGAGGNDTICGLGGDDTIRGGEGDDRLFGGEDGVYVVDEDFWGDTVVPGPGDDHVDLGHDPQSQDLWRGDRGFWDQVSFRDATGPVTVDLIAGTATGEGTDTIAPVVHAAGIEGSAHDDRLRGTDRDDWINAGGGDDHVYGLGGADLIDADRQTLPLTGDQPAVPGDDYVRGGAGHDDISGGHGQDALLGEGGRDWITVEAGSDTRAYGGPGNDSLGGFGLEGVGYANLLGGHGNDFFDPYLLRRSDRVVVSGGGGRDTLSPDLSPSVAPHRSEIVVRVDKQALRTKVGKVVHLISVENYRFGSVSGTARITWHGSAKSESFDAEGTDGRVRAFGRGGADRITGGWGRDLLDGGPGRDRLDGFAGRDRCLRGERLDSCERRG